MPFQVQQIIQGKGKPVSVKKEDRVTYALSLMIEHDYSQLPVIRAHEGRDIPEGMVTYEGILRAVRNFRARIDDLKVRDVMVDAPIHDVEDDLFDILDRLKVTNAVLIAAGDDPDLVGIVTSYDSTEYFRSRTEDLMRVEDIEIMIKELIKAAYVKDDGEIDQPHLDSAIARITGSRPGGGDPDRDFEDLTLSDYIMLLIFKETWPFFEEIFKLNREAVNQLLNGVRQIRNALAHFRKEISADERDRLRFAAEWLNRCHEEFVALHAAQKPSAALEPEPARPVSALSLNLPNLIKALSQDRHVEGDTITLGYASHEADAAGSRYAAFSDWLQSIPGSVNTVQLSFSQIEEIIQASLPSSARQYRAWWANDAGQSRAQLWLDAGWRTTYINLSEGKVTFSRVREREKAYIAFFSKLQDELRKKAAFPVKDASPDGTSWIVVQQAPPSSSICGTFTYSFTRDKRLRVELYLDLGDQPRTKSAFDLLHAQKEAIEAQTGPLEWDRMDTKRASRIAVYHVGDIMDEKGHAELRKWAVETMEKFYGALAEPVARAIEEAKGG